MRDCTLGLNLKKLRKKFGLSQESLSKKLNISRQTLSYYECGTREPDLDTLVNISKIFNCSIDYLLTNNSSLHNYEKSEVLLKEDVFSTNELLFTLKKKKIDFEKSIQELNSIIDFLETKNNNTEFSEELITEIPKNIIPLHSCSNKKSVKVFHSVSEHNNDTSLIPKVGYISAGTPKYACENIEEYFNISKSDLNLAKEYFILEIKGNSMNNLYQDKELVLVDASTTTISDKPIIVLVDSSEATVKYVEVNNDTFKLIPSSTFDEYETSVYSFKNHALHILGTVIGIVKQEED